MFLFELKNNYQFHSCTELIAHVTTVLHQMYGAEASAYMTNIVTQSYRFLPCIHILTVAAVRAHTNTHTHTKQENKTEVSTL